MSSLVLVHKNKLANAVLVFHIVWVGVLLGNPVLLASLEWYAPFGFAVIAATLISQLLFLGCPLSVLEQALRNFGETEDHSWYSGSFVIGIAKRFFGVSPSKVAVVTTTWLLFAISAAVFVGYQVN